MDVFGLCFLLLLHRSSSSSQVSFLLTGFLFYLYAIVLSPSLDVMDDLNVFGCFWNFFIQHWALCRVSHPHRVQWYLTYINTIRLSVL